MSKQDKKHVLPKGFLANGIHCGIKKKRKDLSLFYSQKKCKVAALFTKNMVKAAPVKLAQEQLKEDGLVRAIVVNSGNANCMTGRRGMKDAKRMVKTMANILGVPEEEVLVSSTGIIGDFMEMVPILKGMKTLAKGLSLYGVEDAAHGIMTTDRFPKISTRTFTAGGRKITVTGVAKGAGMIKPDMATMLGYIMTDANITKKALDKVLLASVDVSFNAITVDGDMSTNDMVVLMANGEAGNKIIDKKGADFKIFQKKVNEVSSELAGMIVTDGEGASKFIEVRVRGTKTDKDAKRVAESIADSLLVKCAVSGGDPNWGRIASSAGASGVEFNPDKMDITLDGVVFFKHGHSRAHVNRKATSVFKNKRVLIEVDLHEGNGKAIFFSCDISKKYITLNSYYTT